MDQIKRSKLVDSIRNRPPSHDNELAKVKSVALENSKRADWLWHLLLCSMSTMGNSRGYEGLIGNQNHYALASYVTLLGLEPEKRLVNIRLALEKGKVRMYNIKGRWLDKNFSFIQDCGGLETIQNILLSVKGKESKIQIMRLFEGIGNKYARNIFMDMYHEDFVNSIALDERLFDILKALDVDPSLKYLQKEDVLIQLAGDCSISPWHLDRLLYLFKDYYVERINM